LEVNELSFSKIDEVEFDNITDFDELFSEDGEDKEYYFGKE